MNSWWRWRPGLKAGDLAPDFDLLDEEARRHTFGEHAGRWLVVFFYPRDNTPVCVREACAFNDYFGDFRAAGADILGCSGQNAESHLRMRAACRLQYRLLCDPDRAMREAFKVPRRFGVEGRVTYLIDPERKVRFCFDDAARGEEHAQRTLEFLRAAQGFARP